MKKNIKIILLILALSARFFGQSSKNKIVFLTDFYSGFINNVKANEIKLDSIYEATIQTAIFNTHFKKSEYAYIVKDFFAKSIKNTTELKKSVDRISLNEKLITNKILRALKKSKEQLNIDSLTIYIIPADPASRQTIEQMTGIMGLTAGSKQIILTIEPDVKGWENMLEYAVAHEFNHAYWTHMQFAKSTKWTLLDYLVFEGRGDSFAHLLYPKVKAPWTSALNENERTDLWNKIKPKLQNEDMAFQLEVMFGSKDYPVWGGYTLGYSIVQLALKNAKLPLDKLTNLSSEKILELSNYE